MKTYPLRCKHCAALLDATGGLLQRMFLGGSALECAHCGKSSTRRDAQTMGYSFGRWVDRLVESLLGRVRKLHPVAIEHASRVMHVDATADRMRMMPNADMLCSYITHMFRPVLLEQAHGRESSIEIVGISSLDGHGDTDAAVGVFGCIEDEKGIREWEATIARVGPTQFVVFAPAAPEGFVGEAVRHVHNGGNAAGGAGTSRPTAATTANGTPVKAQTGLHRATA